MTILRAATLAVMIAAPLVLASGSARAVQFVTNGNFATTVIGGTTYLNDTGSSFNISTSGTVSGWTDNNGGYNFLYTSAASATSSSNGTGVALWSNTNGGLSTFSNPTTGGPAFIAMDADYSTGAMSQNISGLAVGQTYVLTFEYGFAQQTNYTNSANSLFDFLAASLGSSVLTSTAGVSCLETDGAGSGGYNFPTIPILWRFHAVHHSERDVDFLTNTCGHPFDMIFTRLCGFTPVFALGLASGGGEVPVAIGLLGVFIGFFIHANVRWRFGWLEWVIATPAFHHWHHTNDEYRDHNYAPNLPIFDKIFGTLHLPKAWPQEYGIDAEMPNGFIDQLLCPFDPKPAPAASP